MPPFFALILRCFSVIEGIALKVDPDYSIVRPAIQTRDASCGLQKRCDQARRWLSGEGGPILSADPPAPCSCVQVGECFPYLAKRLLNDDSPRMRSLLRQILYGDK